MTIARRFMESLRRRSWFEDDLDDDAAIYDYEIVNAVLARQHAAIDGRDWGPMTLRCRRVVDRARADLNHFDPDDAPRIPAETITLRLADYERRTVAAVVAASIRRAA